MKTVDAVIEIKKTNDADSGFGKWETDVSDTLPDSPAATRRNPSSQSNKIFIVSDNHHAENACNPQPSSLYRIASLSKQVD